jgi:hypothetical protein
VDVLLVIVGAGASFDSAAQDAGNHEFRPPLASGLFAELPLNVRLLDRYPRAAPIVARVRLAMDAGASLESVLEELRGEESADPRRRSQLLAIQYYLRALLAECSGVWLRSHGRVTNYAMLADVIDSCRLPSGGAVLYVSFNYDTLLEAGIEASNGPTFGNIFSYVDDADLKLFKVHGSVNWGQVVTHGTFDASTVITPSALCDLAPELAIRPEYRVETRDLEAQAGLPVVIPAIAVPTQTKRNFACPDDHIEALAKALPNVRRVVCIGWRGAEEHFLKLLREGLPDQTPALVVTESRAGCEATAQHLMNARLSPSHVLPDGFTGLMRDDVAGGRTLRRFVEQAFARP